MKNTLRIWIICSFALLCISSLAWSQPVIVVEPNVIEAELEPGEVDEFVINICNDGENDVLLIDINVVGGFIRLEEWENEIEPDEDIDVIITLSAAGLVGGEHEGTLEILSNGLNDPQVFVHVMLEVTGGQEPLHIRHWVQPEEVFVGVPWRGNLVFSNTGRGPVIINAFNDFRDEFYVPVGILPVEIPEEDENVSIPVRFLLEEMVDQFLDTPVSIEYRYNDLNGYDLFVFNGFEPIMPARSNLRPHPNLQGLERIRNLDQENSLDFSLDINEDAQEWLAIEPVEGSIEPGEELEICLTIDPVNLEDDAFYLAEISFQTNDARMPRFIVPFGFKTEGEFSDLLEFGDWFIDFEAVPTGATSFLPFILTNNSQHPIRITEMVLDDETFSIAGRALPIELDRGSFELFRMDYTPQEEGQNWNVLYVQAEIQGQQFEQWAIVSGWGALGLTADPGIIEDEINEGESAEHVVSVVNGWELDLAWSLDFAGDYDWLSVQPSEGIIGGGDSLNLTITLETGSLSPGEHQASFSLANESDLNPVIHVLLDVISGVPVEDNEFAVEFRLDEPYPNPFNSSVIIPFQIPPGRDVRMAIFDVHGRIVNEWNYTSQSGGSHSVSWNGSDRSGQQVGSGIYLCRLWDKRDFRTVRLLLVR